MAKFTGKDKGTKTTNYMGASAFCQTPKEELVFACSTTFLEGKYYESADERVKRIRSLVKKVGPEFTAKLALYVRKNMHMRSVSHLLAAEVAKMAKGEQWTKHFFHDIVERPDDALETVACFWGGKMTKRDGHVIPNAMKKGFAARLGELDEYSLGKYRKENTNLTMVDLIRLVHATSPAIGKLIAGTLKAPDTWEIESSKGDKKTFGKLMKEDKLGYMAALRNARNIILNGSKEDVKNLCNLLSDADKVKKSKQLPFRFLSAFVEVNKLADEYKTGRYSEKITFESDTVSAEEGKKRAKKVLKAIEKAIEHSCQNIPDMPGRTMILTDNSGSMRGDHGGASVISACSNRKTSDIANLFSIMYWHKADNTYVGAFGDSLKQGKLDRKKGLFENFNEFDKVASSVGMGTEAGLFKAFEELIAGKINVDRIIIFSDQQCGRGCSWYTHDGRRGADFNKLYHKYLSMNPKVKMYSVDLQGYGNAMFADGAVKVSGWSDAIFDIMDQTENGTNMVAQVEAIQLGKNQKQ